MAFNKNIILGMAVQIDPHFISEQNKAGKGDN
jgi:hypothetical protein